MIYNFYDVFLGICFFRRYNRRNYHLIATKVDTMNRQISNISHTLRTVIIRPFLFVMSLVTVFCLSSLSVSANEERIFGVWKTQVNDEGSYLHVEIHPCEDKVCGTILNLFRKGDKVDEDYENKGKKMIWDMQPKSETELPSWGKGRIWAPDNDKTYKSGMVLNGGTLKVTGCIALGWPCRSQTWSVVIP